MPPDSTQLASSVLELLARHRTVRRFESTPIPDGVVERSVRAAQRASTSSNVQAYSLLRIRDAARRRTLADWAGGQPQVHEAGAFFVVCADQRRHRIVAESRGEPYAPNLETFLVATIDAALFAQNLCVAFEAQDYGICYIGGLRTRLPEVDALLELPQDVLPLFGLCVGEAAAASPEAPRDGGAAEPAAAGASELRPRLPLAAVLCEERYPTDEALRSLVTEYDRQMSEYYERRGRAGYDWSGGIVRKFLRPQREHLAAFYASKGARLS